MAEEVKASEAAFQQSSTRPTESTASSEERLAESLPLDERVQPDPDLQLSFGRTGAGGITLMVVVAALILGVVLYGLNSPAP